jgi:uncharacterized protein (DUF697 family)
MGAEKGSADADMRGHGDAAKLAQVRKVTTVACIASAAAAVQPIPFVNMALLAPIHIGLVQAIGQIHGHRLDAKSVVEVLATFGTSIVVRGVVMSALKLIPIFGWATAASMAYAMTYAVGEVSHCYFKNGRGMSRGEMRSMFDAVYGQKRAEKEADASRNESLKQRLANLTEAYQAGLLTEEEYRAKKEDVLKDL